MSTTKEIIQISICDDCATLAANGEILDDHDGPEPLGLIEPGWIVSVDCGPEGDGCYYFSWSPCDGCGSRLGGHRHDASMFQV